jgi:hypothetical protein
MRVFSFTYNNERIETINKFMKEKKHLDNFLFELQKEVVESHKSIWKELYSLRNILTLGKSTSMIIEMKMLI